MDNENSEVPAKCPEQFDYNRGTAHFINATPSDVHVHLKSSTELGDSTSYAQAVPSTGLVQNFTVTKHETEGNSLSEYARQDVAYLPPSPVLSQNGSEEVHVSKPTFLALEEIDWMVVDNGSSQEYMSPLSLSQSQHTKEGPQSSDDNGDDSYFDPLFMLENDDLLANVCI